MSKVEKERRCGFCTTDHHDQCSNGREVTRRDNAGEYTVLLTCACGEGGHEW